MSADKDARIAELEQENKQLASELDSMNENYQALLPLYKALQRKLAERDEEHDSLVNMLNMEIERITKKLAEQQAYILKLGNAHYENFTTGSDADTFEELNKLLAKAKEEGRKEAKGEL